MKAKSGRSTRGILFLLSVSILFQYRIGQGSTQASLEDSYQAAIRRSETLSDREQQLIQAQEQESQALGSILPNFSGSAAYFIQQSPSDPVAQTFFPSTQPTVKLTLTQPIFRGLREFAALRQLNHLTLAQEQEKQLALLQLHTEVSQSFFSLLSSEQEVAVLKTQVDLYEDRIQSLKSRTRSGQSSASETITAQAAKAATQAQVKQVEGQYRSGREVFAFLTGLPRDVLLTPPSLSKNLSSEKTPLSTYLEALEKRPDIIAGKQRLDATDEMVSIAKGGHLPSVDVVGNYYLVRPSGVFNEIKWDVQATLTLPIYSGGMTKSKVNEAASRKIQAEMALSRAKRLAEQEVRSLYENYQSGLQQIQALEESMKLAEENYLVLKSDYSKGLTRNIDVLQALSQFQDGKRALSRARWSTQADLTRLQLISTYRPLSTFVPTLTTSRN